MPINIVKLPTGEREKHDPLQMIQRYIEIIEGGLDFASVGNPLHQHGSNETDEIAYQGFDEIIYASTMFKNKISLGNNEPKIIAEACKEFLDAVNKIIEIHEHPIRAGFITAGSIKNILTSLIQVCSTIIDVSPMAINIQNITKKDAKLLLYALKGLEPKDGSSDEAIFFLLENKLVNFQQNPEQDDTSIYNDYILISAKELDNAQRILSEINGKVSLYEKLKDKSEEKDFIKALLDFFPDTAKFNNFSKSEKSWWNKFQKEMIQSIESHLSSETRDFQKFKNEITSKFELFASSIDRSKPRTEYFKSMINNLCKFLQIRPIFPSTANVISQRDAFKAELEAQKEKLNAKDSADEIKPDSKHTP